MRFAVGDVVDDLAGRPTAGHAVVEWVVAHPSRGLEEHVGRCFVVVDGDRESPPSILRSRLAQCGVDRAGESLLDHGDAEFAGLVEEEAPRETSSTVGDR